MGEPNSCYHYSEPVADNQSAPLMIQVKKLTAADQWPLVDEDGRPLRVSCEMISSSTRVLKHMHTERGRDKTGGLVRSGFR